VPPARDRKEVDGMALQQREPVYRQLLRTAYALGREDGAVAVDFETVRPGDTLGERCRGCRPADFARRLWGERPGSPPSGLELCAPRWYADGFIEGLGGPVDR
jgi:hypothetical protein